jgi:hypothetical protein
MFKTEMRKVSRKTKTRIRMDKFNKNDTRNSKEKSSASLCGQQVSAKTRVVLVPMGTGTIQTKNSATSNKEMKNAPL